jgi:predicted deacetylase
MKFILRLDDICPTMDWDRINFLEKILSKYPGVKPIIGVIPSNEDSSLNIHSPRQDFWDQVRGWRDEGWTIAQHGYCHLYTQRSTGLLGIGKHSEFAGLKYVDQYEKLQAGKNILANESVWQPYFMAPSHAFDMVTLEALADLEFDAISDGYGLYPYQIGRLTAVPQLFSSGLNAGFGIYTVCLHPNTMEKRQFNELDILLMRNHNNFVDFPSALNFKSMSFSSTILRKSTEICLRVFRGLKRTA